MKHVQDSDGGPERRGQDAEADERVAPAPASRRRAGRCAGPERSRTARTRPRPRAGETTGRGWHGPPRPAWPTGPTAGHAGDAMGPSSLRRLSFGHSVQSAPADATFYRRGHQPGDRPALGHQLADLRARDVDAGPGARLDPPARRRCPGAHARSGHDHQGDEARQVLGPVPGGQRVGHIGPDDEEQLGGLAGPRPRPRRRGPRPSRPCSWGRRGRARCGWTRTRQALDRRRHERQAVLGRADVAHRALLPRVVGDDEEHPVERELPARPVAAATWPTCGRVEGARRGCRGVRAGSGASADEPTVGRPSTEWDGDGPGGAVRLVG